MKIICAKCKTRRKNYLGNMPDDGKSWICTICYNEMNRRVTNLKGAVDELNETIMKLKKHLANVPETFREIFNPDKRSKDPLDL